MINRKHYEELYQFFKSLDRSFFLDDAYKNMACYDGPLPIGHGQTISQPTLVLEMTAQLDLHSDSRVLEIGTGSGYQTVLLAAFSLEVYTIERIPELLHKAENRLRELKYQNVHFKLGDGSEGWPEKAPFDRIIVTAAAGAIPETLVDQLAPGGKMIVPVGPPTSQDLLLISKNEHGSVKHSSLGGVRFVEFIGRYGWR